MNDPIGLETAVLFFDTINVHVKEDEYTIKASHQNLVPRLVKLMDSARSHNLAIFFAYANHRSDNKSTVMTLRDTDNRLNNLPKSGEPKSSIVYQGGWGNQIISELESTEFDFMIPKYRWSAFHQTCLDLMLRANRIERLILVGGSTDVGIASTAFAARDKDYHLLIASDGCISPEADNHQQFMTRIFPRMAQVREIDEIIARLE